MGKIAKAIVAGLSALLAVLVSAVVKNGGAPDAGQVAVALVSGVVAGLATWRVPNAQAGAPATPAGQ